MASMHSKWVNGNLVFYESGKEYRWIDAIGPSVIKFVDHFVTVPIGEDNNDPPGWTMTAIAGDAGDATITAGTTNSGEMVLTTDDTENDGFNIQLAGEAFKLEDDMPLYFGVRLKCSDADQSDLMIGLSITDTGFWADGITDGVYWESADETGVLTFTAEKDSTESEDTNAGTLTDAYHVLEFYWDGSTYIHAYFDGTLSASLSGANIPDDEALTPTIELLTGEGNTNSVTLDWLRVIQCR